VTDGVLDLSCGMEADTIKIILIDYGEPYDPSEIPMPDIKADLSERKIGGLGIFLMRKLMDEVQYEPKSNKSNILTMIKHKR
jgi:serine/threonine-protein kinase RsbW